MILFPKKFSQDVRNIFALFESLKYNFFFQNQHIPICIVVHERVGCHQTTLVVNPIDVVSGPPKIRIVGTLSHPRHFSFGVVKM